MQQSFDITVRIVIIADHNGQHPVTCQGSILQSVDNAWNDVWSSLCGNNQRGPSDKGWKFGGRACIVSATLSTSLRGECHSNS
jgi:hypothetical protein